MAVTSELREATDLQHTRKCCRVHSLEYHVFMLVRPRTGQIQHPGKLRSDLTHVQPLVRFR